MKAKYLFLLSFLAVPVKAQLLDGSVLSIDSASWFSFDNLQVISIQGHDGLVTGITQTASGAHAGLPDGSEMPGIDEPWYLNNATGMHWTSSPVSILSASGNTASLDFSGWSAAWNDLSDISLGSDYQNPETSGVAQIVCGTDCSVGDSYSLTYTALVTYPSTVFDSLRYDLYLQGTITAVPLPAAIWLFGSGLLGLIGATGRSRSKFNM